MPEQPGPGQACVPAAATPAATCVAGLRAERLMTLPGQTLVRSGCGADTTIGAERAVIDCLRGQPTA